MSQEEIEVIRRFWTAWNSGDRDRWTRLVAADAELEPPAERMTPGPPIYYGPQGWLEYATAIDEMLEEVSYEPEQFFDAPGGVILAYVKVTGIGQGSGAPFEQRLAHVYRVRNGLIARLQIIMDRQLALEAVGLRE